jgi:hypothetical protein
MKNLFVHLALAAALGNLLNSIQPVLAQGSLTPPGAPGPTMKTLTQVEPRTPVASNTTPGNGTALFVISQPGSYYLTTNINGSNGLQGIEITASDVTLDLNGFALLGSASSYAAIYIPSTQTNITVRNGTIISWGASGVYSTSANSVNQVCERLNISATIDGIYLIGNYVVRDCNCSYNQFTGIVCQGTGFVSDCVADNNGTIGINCESAVITGCVAEDNDLDGIDCYGGMVSRCFVSGNASEGILLDPGTVSGCLAENSTYSGIEVEANGCTIIGNTCVGNNSGGSTFAAGIFINGANNRVEDNHVVTAIGHVGIEVFNETSDTNNVIIKNSVIGDGANNYSILAAGNDLGPVGTAATSTSPWANISH